jgi:hypothetical protein
VSATIKLFAIAKLEAKASGKKVGLRSKAGHYRELVMFIDAGELGSIRFPVCQEIGIVPG